MTSFDKKKLNQRIRDIEHEYSAVLRNIKEWRSRASANMSDDNLHQLSLYLTWKYSLTNELIKHYWKSLELN